MAEQSCTAIVMYRRSILAGAIVCMVSMVMYRLSILAGPSYTSVYCYVPADPTNWAILCICLLLCTIGRYWLHGSLHVCPFCYVLLVHTGRAIVCVRLLFYNLSILAGPIYVWCLW